MLPTLLLGVTVAAAHPMAGNLNGQRLDLRLDPGLLTVDYLVEIPTQRLVRDLRAFLAERPAGTGLDAYKAALKDELRDGLRLRADDALVPWTRVALVPPRGQDDGRFAAMRLSLEATLPEGARTLQLVNGNLPDEANLYLVDVLVGEGLVVDDCSLWERSPQGDLELDRSGQWQIDEGFRDVRLAMRPRSAWSEAALKAARVLGGVADPYAPAAERRADAPFGGVDRAGRWAILALAGALALGAALSPRGRGRPALGRLAAALAPPLLLAAGLALAWGREAGGPWLRLASGVGLVGLGVVGLVGMRRAARNASTGSGGGLGGALGAERWLGTGVAAGMALVAAGLDRVLLGALLPLGFSLVYLVACVARPVAAAAAPAGDRVRVAVVSLAALGALSAGLLFIWRSVQSMAAP